jgi:hypothetical protein
MLFSAAVDVWLLQADVVLVLLDPGLDETSGLPDVDLTSLVGHSVRTRSLEFQVNLHTPKEAGDLLRG